MSKSKFSISNLDLYYDNGAFKALKNINLRFSLTRLLHLSVLPDVVNPHC